MFNPHKIRQNNLPEKVEETFKIYQVFLEVKEKSQRHYEKVKRRVTALESEVKLAARLLNSAENCYGSAKTEKLTTCENIISNPGGRFQSFIDRNKQEQGSSPLEEHRQNYGNTQSIHDNLNSKLKAKQDKCEQLKRDFIVNRKNCNIHRQRYCDALSAWYVERFRQQFESPEKLRKLVTAKLEKYFKSDKNALYIVQNLPAERFEQYFQLFSELFEVWSKIRTDHLHRYNKLEIVFTRLIVQCAAEDMREVIDNIKNASPRNLSPEKIKQHIVLEKPTSERHLFINAFALSKKFFRKIERDLQHYDENDWDLLLRNEAVMRWVIAREAKNSPNSGLIMLITESIAEDLINRTGADKDWVADIVYKVTFEKAIPFVSSLATTFCVDGGSIDALEWLSDKDDCIELVKECFDVEELQESIRNEVNPIIDRLRSYSELSNSDRIASRILKSNPSRRISSAVEEQKLSGNCISVRTIGGSNIKFPLVSKVVFPHLTRERLVWAINATVNDKLEKWRNKEDYLKTFSRDFVKGGGYFCIRSGEVLHEFYGNNDESKFDEVIKQCVGTWLSELYVLEAKKLVKVIASQSFTQLIKNNFIRDAMGDECVFFVNSTGLDSTNIKEGMVYELSISPEEWFVTIQMCNHNARSGDVVFKLDGANYLDALFFDLQEGSHLTGMAEWKFVIKLDFTNLKNGIVISCEQATASWQIHDGDESSVISNISRATSGEKQDLGNAEESEDESGEKEDPDHPSQSNKGARREDRCGVS